MGKGLIILIFLIILILISSTGVYIYTAGGKPKIISTSTQDVLSCSDSDGKDINQKGYSGYEVQEPGETSFYNSEDWCDYNHPKTKSRVGILREGFCENNQFKQDFTTCGRGFVCRNGACIKGNEKLGICTDTDGGIVANKRGEIQGYGGSGMDNCWISLNVNPELDGGYTNDCSGNGCYIYEYYCENDAKQYQIIPCPNGCLNGACS